jgi:hypothetical protein
VGPVAGRLGFLLAFTMVSAAVVLGALGAAHAALSRRVVLTALLPGAAILAVTQVADLPPAPMGVIAGAVLLLLGSWIGAALGRGVHEASYLWPLVMVALGADLWSVTSPEGVTNQLVVESGTSMVTSLILLGAVVPGVGPSPLLGLGDVVFSGFLAGAVVRLGLSSNRLAAGLAVGYALTASALLVLELPLPALPFIGIAGVAALGWAARPKASEVATAAGFLALLFGLRLLAG